MELALELIDTVGLFKSKMRKTNQQLKILSRQQGNNQPKQT
jgi:hypothetical protein